LRTSSSSMRGRRLGGFSLTEMLFVIAIIVTLSALLIPAVSRIRRRAVVRRTKSFCEQIENAWKSYHTRYRRWPDTDVKEMNTAAMEILAGSNVTHNSQKIVFMEFWTEEWNVGQTGVTGMRDPWGNLYRVALDNGRGWDVGNPANNVIISIPSVGQLERRVAAWSAGLDGQDGTADDVRSWE
jgi:type II secretory pathway pseudopilin PulG